MKEFLTKEFYYNTISDWGIALLIIIAAIIVGKLAYWFFGTIAKRITAKTASKLDDIIVDMVEEPVVLAITIIGLWVGFDRLSFPEEGTLWLGKVYHVLITINVTWLIARMIDAFIREYVIPLAKKTASDLDDQLVPVLRKSLRSTIWILGIIVALNNAGYDVTALIAGLGIGGLALAMAAKDSVSNIFGGIMVFTDKPFKVGDRIKVGGYDGTITEVGIRTSRMRTLENRLVTIPNSQFTGNMVENVSAEPSRKVILNLGLTYDMDASKMELAVELLKEIASNNEDLEDDITVGFNTFGDFSLGILFIYFIKKGSEIIPTQTAINLAILKKYAEHNLEMAFPTQTIHTISTQN